MRPKRIGILGFDQVTALHLVGPATAFAAAALDDGYGGRIPCYDVHIIGVTSDRFRSECGLRFEVERTLSHAPVFDTVIIAGGSGIRRPPVAEKIAAWLLKRIDWRRIGTICAGIYGLAPTGLLDGRDVTTHWRFARDVTRRFPRLKLDHRRPFVKDGPYYTSTGLSAGINLSLAMIEEDYGPNVARSVEGELTLHLTDNDFELPSAGVPLDNYPIDRFADLVAWVLRNLHADLSLPVLAQRACMDPGHFSKVFKRVFGQAPTDFVANLRLNEARRRLAKRQNTLRAVATSVGFSDLAAFQRAIARRFGGRHGGCIEEWQAAKHEDSVLSPNGRSSLRTTGNGVQPKVQDARITQTWNAGC
jgi:transcriptional regulator GlxA family with amidase domain